MAGDAKAVQFRFDPFCCAVFLKSRFRTLNAVNLESGQVRALVVPGRRRFFGLLGREEDKVIPWSAVKRFGEDIILVEQ